MIVAIPRETAPGERRVALVPDAGRALRAAGVELVVESGAGEAAGFPDSAYEQAGFSVEADSAAVWGRADVLLKVQPPREREDGRHEADLPKEGAAWIGFLRPLDEPELSARLAERRLTAFSVELMPRITRAQSMDALSAMSTVAGYRAVLRGAVTLRKMFPMLVTAAGTISPARVLVIGAGVAGLQAIATAKRLGAVVEAYDTRPAVKEQVESLGGKFVELPLETGEAEDAGGYAKAQSEEFLARQRELLAQRVQASNLVITTALVPGAPAPRLIEEEVVRGMRPGAVIVDLAAAAGGNCALTRPDESVEAHGVTVLGPTNLPSEAATDASQMYAKNLVTFLQHLLQDGALHVDLEDEITSATLVAHEGKVVSETVRSRLEGGR